MILMNSIRLQDFPQGFVVNAVKCLSEVDEIDKHGNSPLNALLHDLLKSKYLICATSALPESGLFFTKFAVNRTVNSVQCTSTEDFSGDEKKGDPTPGVTFLEVSFLGDLDN